ncbi:MAG: hypothetical protein AAFV53_01265 [Myxococcota bacterium]
MKRDDVQIPSPCSADWSEMTGDDARRFCDQCAKHVHDLSAMTEPEAKALLKTASSAGELCVRYTVGADQTITFRKNRARRLATAGMVAAGLAAAIPASAGIMPADTDEAACAEGPLTRMARQVYETFFGPSEPIIYAGAVDPVDIEVLGEFSVDPEPIDPIEMVEMGEIAVDLEMAPTPPPETIVMGKKAAPPSDETEEDENVSE